jgi:hypothetical protein
MYFQGIKYFFQVTVKSIKAVNEDCGLYLMQGEYTVFHVISGHKMNKEKGGLKQLLMYYKKKLLNFTFGKKNTSCKRATFSACLEGYHNFPFCFYRRDSPV